MRRTPLKIDLRSEGTSATYFPASVASEELKAETDFYDRQQGIVGYRLTRPARVHLQVGSGRLDPKTGEWMGPCLKTIVNREPRVAGSVVEHWNGFDESGAIYAADLPNFTMSLFATALPENAVIATGNRQFAFADQVARRTGNSLITSSLPKGERHQGLSTLEDTAPQLSVRPTSATWVADQRAWVASGKTLGLEVVLAGPSARVFEIQPGAVMVFVGDELVREVDARPGPIAVSIPTPTGREPTQRVTVNWVSNYGPVAANSLMVGRGQSAQRMSGKSPTVPEPRSVPGGQP